MTVLSRWCLTGLLLIAGCSSSHTITAEPSWYFPDAFRSLHIGMPLESFESVRPRMVDYESRDGARVFLEKRPAPGVYRAFYFFSEESSLLRQIVFEYEDVDTCDRVARALFGPPHAWGTHGEGYWEIDKDDEFLLIVQTTTENRLTIEAVLAPR